MIAGLAERLQKEMSAVAAPIVVKVIAPPTRQHSCWLGGSMQANLASFQNQWMLRDEHA